MANLTNTKFQNITKSNSTATGGGLQRLHINKFLFTIRNKKF